MTKAEIDKTISTMMEIKKSGQFRSFWTSFDQSVNLNARARSSSSRCVAAVTAVRTRAFPAPSSR